MMRKDRATFADKFVRGLFQKPQSEPYLKRVRESSLCTPTEAAYSLSVASTKADNRAALNKIDKPTLIIRATIPESAATDMQKRIKNSKVEFLADTGHAVFVDDPVKFNTLLDYFLTEVAY